MNLIEKKERIESLSREGIVVKIQGIYEKGLNCTIKIDDEKSFELIMIKASFEGFLFEVIAKTKSEKIDKVKGVFKDLIQIVFEGLDIENKVMVLKNSGPSSYGLCEKVKFNAYSEEMDDGIKRFFDNGSEESEIRVFYSNDALEQKMKNLAFSYKRILGGINNSGNRFVYKSEKLISGYKLLGKRMVFLHEGFEYVCTVILYAKDLSGNLFLMKTKIDNRSNQSSRFTLEQVKQWEFDIEKLISIHKEESKIQTIVNKEMRELDVVHWFEEMVTHMTGYAQEEGVRLVSPQEVVHKRQREVGMREVAKRLLLRIFNDKNNLGEIVNMININTSFHKKFDVCCEVLSETKLDSLKSIWRCEVGSAKFDMKIQFVRRGGQRSFMIRDLKELD